MNQSMNEPTEESKQEPKRAQQDSVTIRITLPTHLCTLAHVNGELNLVVDGLATQRSVLNALEKAYPVLRGTIRDHGKDVRRPWLRFFACGQDLSHEDPGAQLPEAVVQGAEPYLIVGAIAGG